MDRVRPFVLLDTETTGLGVRRMPWEVAATLIDPSIGRWEDHEIFIDVSLQGASEEALKVGGYYERHPGAAWSQTATFIHARPRGDFLTVESAGAFLRYLTRGAMVVGANPWFDMHTLSNLMGEEGDWYYRPMCVENLVAGRKGGTPRSLSDSAAIMGVRTGDIALHTAGGDVEVVRRILVALGYEWAKKEKP